MVFFNRRGRAQVKNLRRAIKEFEGLEKKVQKKIARQGTRAGAKIVQGRMKQLSPVGEETDTSGLMKRSIKVRAMKRSRKRLAGHAARLEVPYGSFVVLGTKFIDGENFPLEAAIEAEPRVRRKFRRIFIGGIKKIARESKAK